MLGAFPTVLANDDTAGQASSQSTLTGTATDGSGFVLTQPGDYVLIVGGSLDVPQDSSNINLFKIDSDLQSVHAANPIGERFEHWVSWTVTGILMQSSQTPHHGMITNMTRFVSATAPGV